MNNATLQGFRMLAECVETYRRPGKTCDRCDGQMTADDGDAGDGLCEECWQAKEAAEREEREFIEQIDAADPEPAETVQFIDDSELPF